MSYGVRGVCPCGSSCTPERTDGVLRHALLDVSSALRSHVEQEHPGQGITDDDGLVIKSVTVPDAPDHSREYRNKMREAHGFILQGLPVIIVYQGRAS